MTIQNANLLTNITVLEAQSLDILIFNMKYHVEYARSGYHATSEIEHGLYTWDQLFKALLA